jgi:Polysaccharide deacetylase
VLASAVCLLLLVPSAARAGTTVVTLGFDDGDQTQYQVRPILAGHKMHATFYINSGEVGSGPYYMTWSQIHDFAADGNEIAGHSLTHPFLTQLTPAQQRTEICQDRKNLLNQGFSPVVSFAYPYDKFTSTTKSIVKECGYSTGRRAGGLGCCGYPVAERIPPLDPFATRTPPAIESTTSLATMQSYVTKAERSGGGWVQFSINLVCDGCAPLSIRPSQLTAFLDWLKPRAAAGTFVATAGEVHTARAGLRRFTRKMAASKARRALRRKYRRAYARGKRKRLSCKRLSLLRYRCNFSFRYGKRKPSGTVLVRLTAAGIKATVKAR